MTYAFLKSGGSFRAPILSVKRSEQNDSPQPAASSNRNWDSKPVCCAKQLDGFPGRFGQSVILGVNPTCF